MSKKGTATKYAKSLSEVMTKLRELKGIGLREHARQLDMSAATLSRIERLIKYGAKQRQCAVCKLWFFKCEKHKCPTK